MLIILKPKYFRKHFKQIICVNLSIFYYAEHSMQ